MNRAGCPCGTKEKSPRTSPYCGDAGGAYQTQGYGSGYGQSSRPPQGQSTGYSYGPSQDICLSPYKPSGTGVEQGTAPQRRPPCGPQPCGRPACPKSPKPKPISMIDSRPPITQNNEEVPKGFEMNNANWSLCASIALFCCGVYLTKKMAIVASELG